MVPGMQGVMDPPGGQAERRAQAGETVRLRLLPDSLRVGVAAVLVAIEVLLTSLGSRTDHGGSEQKGDEETLHDVNLMT